MLKRYAPIFLLTLAYAILLGHNIVPHHHHDSKHELTEHHHSHHQHGEDEGMDLSDLFSHFVHSSDDFMFTAGHSFSNNVSNQMLSFDFILPDEILFTAIFVPLFRHKPPAELPIYYSPHSHSCGLRAPPSSFV
ncbi:MAG: hypothetical protein KA444_04270 [Bacteroidia bacterium]|nr:hypothetical protein [Bacteroidia bacterium]